MPKLIPKLSLSMLFWLVSIVAVILVVGLTQRSLREKVAALDSAKQQIADYRQRLGEIDVVNPDRYYIRYFNDQYTEGGVLRSRIYVPDASLCNIYFSYGTLPRAGLPEFRQKLNPHHFRKARGNLILVVEIREIFEKQFMNEFQIRLYSELGGLGGGGTPNQSLKMKAVDWIPGSGKGKSSLEYPFNVTASFQLDKPFVMLKHFEEATNGSLTGYMLWMEEVPSPKPVPSK